MQTNSLVFLIISIISLLHSAASENTITADEVTLEAIDNFKRSRSLQTEEEIHLQTLGASNTLMHGGTQYILDEIDKKLDIFSEGATYMHNGIPGDLPTPNIYQDENDKEVITVVKNSNQEILTLTIYNKITQKTSEISKVQSGVFATIEEDYFDYEEINARYSYGEHRNGEQSGPVHVNGHSNKMQTNETCSYYRILELAVAYESSFCTEYGGKDDTETKVASIVTDVSTKYMQSPLCIKVQISHLEGYCDSSSDPYKEFVDLNASGCGTSGLLQAVQSYWNDNRNGINRDSMQLFSGTGLECDFFGSCVIGCAFTSVLCDIDFAYGVNYVTYSSSSNLQSVLVAHELGHNCGADHEPESGYIMNAFINPAENGFSSTSINSFNTRIDATSCITQEEITTSSPSLSSRPSTSSSPSTYPSKRPSALPSTYPSKRPSALPSTYPSKQPSALPSIYPSMLPSALPSIYPSMLPSTFPSNVLSTFPSNVLSTFPSLSPSFYRSSSPSTFAQPSNTPTQTPSVSPPCLCLTATNIMSSVLNLF